MSRCHTIQKYAKCQQKPVKLKIAYILGNKSSEVNVCHIFWGLPITKCDWMFYLIENMQPVLWLMWLWIRGRTNTDWLMVEQAGRYRWRIVSICRAIGNALKQIQIATHMVSKISPKVKYQNVLNLLHIYIFFSSV